MAETVNEEELRANLKEYKDQLEQVEQLLLDDPTNEEYLGIYEGLAQVLKLTEEVLEESQRQAAPPALAAGSSRVPIAAVTEAPEVKVPSVLPPQVADQIRNAQQRAALAGQAPAAWAIGAKVEALFGADGMWYAATVTGVSVSGKFIVTFDSYGNVEEVDRQDIKPADVKVETTGTGYKGVEAPKRHQVADKADAEMQEVPKWLEIKPTDDEKTKQKKKKLVKSYKSKTRFQQMDMVQKQKADAWKNFQGGKGAKKTKGFMTGRKKSSMFSVAEGSQAKVGVVGSGQGMTQHEGKKRHEFNFDGTPADDGAV